MFLLHWSLVCFLWFYSYLAEILLEKHFITWQRDIWQCSSSLVRNPSQTWRKGHSSADWEALIALAGARIYFNAFWEEGKGHSKSGKIKITLIKQTMKHSWKRNVWKLILFLGISWVLWRQSSFYKMGLLSWARS